MTYKKQIFLLILMLISSASCWNQRFILFTPKTSCNFRISATLLEINQLESNESDYGSYEISSRYPVYDTIKDTLTPFSPTVIYTSTDNSRHSVTTLLRFTNKVLVSVHYMCQVENDVLHSVFSLLENTKSARTEARVCINGSSGFLQILGNSRMTLQAEHDVTGFKLVARNNITLGGHPLQNRILLEPRDSKYLATWSSPVKKQMCGVTIHNKASKPFIVFAGTYVTAKDRAVSTSTLQPIEYKLIQPVNSLLHLGNYFVLVLGFINYVGENEHVELRILCPERVLINANCINQNRVECVPPIRTLEWMNSVTLEEGAICILETTDANISVAVEVAFKFKEMPLFYYHALDTAKMRERFVWMNDGCKDTVKKVILIFIVNTTNALRGLTMKGETICPNISSSSSVWTVAEWQSDVDYVDVQNNDGFNFLLYVMDARCSDHIYFSPATPFEGKWSYQENLNDASSTPTNSSRKNTCNPYSSSKHKTGNPNSSSRNMTEVDYMMTFYIAISGAALLILLVILCATLFCKRSTAHPH